MKMQTPGFFYVIASDLHLKHPKNVVPILFGFLHFLIVTNRLMMVMMMD